MDSVFRGTVGAGTISASFLSDPDNADDDLLVIAYAPIGGGSSGMDRAVSNPGGRARVSLQAADEGVLEVWVAIGTLTDRGRLSVSLDGVAVHEEDVKGSVRWVYSVQGR
jgi:hypothetical protein